MSDTMSDNEHLLSLCRQGISTEDMDASEIKAEVLRRMDAGSAAPDLLEALEELADLAYHHMVGGYGHAIDNARRAIAKAKGEAK